MTIWTALVLLTCALTLSGCETFGPGRYIEDPNNPGQYIDLAAGGRQARIDEEFCESLNPGASCAQYANCRFHSSTKTECDEALITGGYGGRQLTFPDHRCWYGTPDVFGNPNRMCEYVTQNMTLLNLATIKACTENGKWTAASCYALEACKAGPTPEAQCVRENPLVPCATEL